MHEPPTCIETGCTYKVRPQKEMTEEKGVWAME